jgi:hypothetical protein
MRPIDVTRLRRAEVFAHSGGAQALVAGRVSGMRGWLLFYCCRHPLDALGVRN